MKPLRCTLGLHKYEYSGTSPLGTWKVYRCKNCNNETIE